LISLPKEKTPRFQKENHQFLASGNKEFPDGNFLTEKHPPVKGVLPHAFAEIIILRSKVNLACQLFFS